MTDDGRRLGEVEALALRQALDDVHQDHVGQAGLRDALGGRGAHIAGADDGDLVACHDDQPSAFVSGSSGIGPALRTASETPAAYLAKLSWNIPAILLAAAS